MSTTEQPELPEMTFENIEDLEFLNIYRQLSTAKKEQVLTAFVKKNKAGKKVIARALQEQLDKYWPEAVIEEKKELKPNEIANAIADTLLSKNKIKTVMESVTVLKFENGGWRDMPKIEIANIAQKIGGPLTTNFIVDEVVGKITRDNLISIEDFERRPDLLMDANGNVFNVITREFEEVTEENVTVIHKIGAVFNPEIEVSKAFLEVIELIIPDETERNTLQEHLGSCLYRKMLYDKLIILLGRTRNGKTTLLEIVEAVFGSANTATTALQDISKNFRLYTLWRKLFNFVDDISREAVRNTSALKMMSGGAPLTIEQKYGQPFTASLYAKSIFGANQMPIAADKDDDGYYSKILIIQAPNTFLLQNEIGPDGLQDGEYNANPNLVNDITSNPDNLSGILNWMLEGLHRLNEQGGYSLKMTLEEAKVRYDALAAPEGELRDFLNMITDRDYSMQGVVRKADLLAMYRIYCDIRHVPRPSMHDFNKTLKNLGLNPDYRKVGYDEKPVYAMYDAEQKSPYLIKNIRFKEDWEEILNSMQAMKDGVEPEPEPEPARSPFSEQQTLKTEA